MFLPFSVIVNNAVMPYMDEDMRQLAAAAVKKLQAMTDSEFSEREFILTDED